MKMKDKPFKPQKPIKQQKFKKNCVFCDRELEIDYKNMDLLSRYISGKGKIVSRRISGNCAGHQRKMAKEIKRARYLSLMPYANH
jgi:small subunit ribosomal protein S18